MGKKAIWCAGEFGKYVYEQLEDVVAFIDNNANLKRDIPVLSIDDFLASDISSAEIWLAASNYYVMDDIIYQMHELGIEKVRIVDPMVWKYKKKIIMDSKECYLLDLREKAVLNKLEFHVADHCNLNCAGCSHFSPTFPEQFADINSFRDMVKRLAELFSNIFQFRLMGGEPFLNKQLDEFILTVREYFPNTHLTIVTNGLLYHKVDPKIWDCIKENEAYVQVSLYPPTAEIQDKLKQFFQEQKIPFSFGSGLEQYNDEGVIRDFHKCLTLENCHDKHLSASNCFGAWCHYLRDGKISKCAFPQLIGQVNSVFGTEFECHEEDVVDIYKNDNGWNIVDRLRGPIPFCGYCIEGKPIRYEWDVCKKESDEIENYILLS